MIKDNIYYIGVNDRETELFENMWPLREGVSYNSFLIKGEKNIIIDAVHISTFDVYIEKIKNILGNEGKVDYLFINHMEPDHSSSIKMLLEYFPEMKLVGNLKTKEFFQHLYKIEGDFIIVDENQDLKIGEDVFKFIKTPMVHWPESMFTYYANKKVLFTQDAFGGFKALDGAIYDDQVDIENYRYEVERYFTNIVGRFSMMIKRAFDKVKDLQIDAICPVHGLVFRKNPKVIMDIYSDLVNFKTQDNVTICYGSMYGGTKKMAEYLAKKIVDLGINTVEVFDVSKVHISDMITKIWKNKAFLLGTCTYDNGIYPNMEFLLSEIKRSKMKNHVVGVFGTYGWSGGGCKGLDEFFKNNKDYDYVQEYVEARLHPGKEDFEKLDKLALEIVNKVKNN